MRLHRLLVLLAFPLPLLAQDTAPSEAIWRASARSWDEGNYIAALEGMRVLLDGDDPARFQERIALQTGEWHRSTELTPDGSRPAFSPDGQWLSWESGSGAGRVTRLARAGAPSAVVAELPGTGAALSPGNTLVAWLHPEDMRRPPLGVRDLRTGHEVPVQGMDGWMPTGVTFGTDDATLLITASRADQSDRNAILLARRRGAAFVVERPIGAPDGFKHHPVLLPGGRFLLHVVPAGNPVRLPTGATGFRLAQRFAVVELATGASRVVDGSAPTISADGRRVAWVEREGETWRLVTMPIEGGALTEVVRTTDRLDAPALSPDGLRIAYQRMPAMDWELYVVQVDGTDDRRLTFEIQHDLFPQWLDARSLIAVLGEARHRRVYRYDAVTGARTKLFHNNTVRTIAPEYDWIPSADGTRLLIVAERDGNTVSPERGVYLLDLTATVTAGALHERVVRNLAAEIDLRDRGVATFAPIAPAVRARTEQVQVSNVYGYSRDLFAFGSKHISQPGNARAIAYLDSTYRSFGLEVTRQYFAPRGALGDSTANVLAILRGTTHPELVYVVSSHFDSRAEGPGADDNTSGTAALLEAARVLARHPQPATIIFASFTGEESGLLGSREWVRQAVRDSLRVVGALNNDMVGFANDFRLDNTIRYSNPGIRDIQHAAAMQFSALITYDALYYKSTDAAAYYEAWGDIVGGIGSYPVLGNPHYHQPHDVLETINHQLVAEVSRTTVATLMLLASSPARVTGLRVAARAGDAVEVAWIPSPERGVTGYLVTWGPPEAPGRQQRRVAGPTARLEGVAPAMTVQVKALTGNGLDGWDWARVGVEQGPVGGS